MCIQLNNNQPSGTTLITDTSPATGGAEVKGKIGSDQPNSSQLDNIFSGFINNGLSHSEGMSPREFTILNKFSQLMNKMVDVIKDLFSMMTSGLTGSAQGSEQVAGIDPQLLAPYEELASATPTATDPVETVIPATTAEAIEQAPAVESNPAAETTSKTAATDPDKASSAVNENLEAEATTESTTDETKNITEKDSKKADGKDKKEVAHNKKNTKAQQGKTRKAALIKAANLILKAFKR